MKSKDRLAILDEALRLLGQRAIEYWNDTGECLFCSVNLLNDDTEEWIHEEHCNVGEIAQAMSNKEIITEISKPLLTRFQRILKNIK